MKRIIQINASENCENICLKKRDAYFKAGEQNKEGDGKGSP